MADDGGRAVGASVPEAENEYEQVAVELADRLDDVIVAWITRVVHQRLAQDPHADHDDALQARIVAVAEQIHARVVPELQSLLTADVADQAAGPLAVLRGCVGPANRLLADAGVTPPARDPVAVSMFPDDPYDLGPANFDDVDPDLHDLGLVWGAAKAHVVLLRHRH